MRSLALLVALSGCGAVIEVTADPTTLELAPTPETEEAVLAAVAEWNACGATRHAVIGHGPTAVTVDLVDSSDPVLEGYAGITLSWQEAAGTPCRPESIHVARDADVSILRHEVGHALMPWRCVVGTHFGDGLMRAAPRRDAHVTAEDCAALREGDNT